MFFLFPFDVRLSIVGKISKFEIGKSDRVFFEILFCQTRKNGTLIPPS